MTKSALLTALIFVTYFAGAQQLPLFTQYRDNLGVINPAAPSSDFLIYNLTTAAGASYRKQWTGIDNAPETQVLRYEHIDAYSGNAFSPMYGASAIRDVTGPLGMTGIYGKFGAAFSDDAEEGGFSAAFSGGLVSYHLDTDKIKVRDADDFLAAGRRTQLYPDIGMGVFCWKKISVPGFFDDDMLSGGLSVPQLMGLNLRFRNDDQTFSVRRIQHYYGQFSWLHSIEDREKFIQTSLWLKYVPNTPVNVDLNLRYQLIQALWIGLGASSGGNFHAETGFNFDSGMDGLLRLGYGFDYSFSRIGPFAGSTHEFSVSYSFGGR